MWKHKKTNLVGKMHTSQASHIIIVVWWFFLKPIISSFFLSIPPSTFAPLIFRIPVWFKVDPTRKQNSVKQGLICYNFLFACWMDLCIRNRKRHQKAKADFIFSLQSQPKFSSLIISFSLQLGHVAVLIPAKKRRNSQPIVVRSPHFHNPTSSFSHGQTYSHIYTMKTQQQMDQLIYLF